MSPSERRAALHKLLHECVLDLIITCKFLPDEVILEMVQEMTWLRSLNDDAS